MEFICWLIFIKIVTQVVKRLKKIDKKEEIEKDKKDRDKKHCKKTFMFKFSSNVNDVMKAISNLFFLRENFAHTKSTKSTKTQTSDFPPLRCFLCT